MLVASNAILLARQQYTDSVPLSLDHLHLMTASYLHMIETML